MTSIASAIHGTERRPATTSMTQHARFEQIYNSYSGLILAYAARRTQNIDDAADVVAETFTVAWRRIGDVPAGEEARPWLYGVARRVLANQHRSVKRRTRLDDKLRSAAASTRAVPLDAGSDRASTLTALSRLSDQDQELITLTAWDGLDSNDLAIVLRCGAGTARVRLHRARRRFEQHLEAERGNE